MRERTGKIIVFDRYPQHQDRRVQELLHALNERLMPEELVREKVVGITGRRVDFYRYRDGSYFIVE